MGKLRHLLLPSRAERELAREVQAHLALLEDEYRRRGLTPDQAAAAARRDHGNLQRRQRDPAAAAAVSRRRSVRAARRERGHADR
jgi:hypothetical protein